MAPRKHKRPRHDFGNKVAHLLADRKTKNAEPSNNVALARMVGVSEGAVRGWITRGTSPGASTAHAVAVVFSVDPEWLTNDAKGWPAPDAATSLAVVLKLIPQSEQDALAPILADPRERRKWIASWRAGQ